MSSAALLSDSGEISFTSCDLLLKFLGAWSLEGELSATEAPVTGAAKFRVLGQELQGVILHAEITNGRVRLTAAGGRGELWREVVPRGYTEVRASLVLKDIADAAGESLSADSTTSQRLTSWTRQRGRAGDAIDALAASVGASWRVLVDGLIWFGLDAWTDVGEFTHIDLELNAAEGWQVIGPETLALRPGMSYQGRKVGDIHYFITDSESRAKLWFLWDDREPPVLAGLRAIIREVLAEELGIVKLYQARAVRQGADGRVDLDMDGDESPDLSNVPLYVPCPGAKVTLPSAGARVLMGYLAGDPTAPLALACWEQGNGSKPAARKDDTGSGGTLVIASGAVNLGTGALTALAGTYTPPGGVATPWTLGNPINLQIRIDTGSPHLSLPEGSTP